MRKFVKAALFAGAAWSAMAGMAAAQDAPAQDEGVTVVEKFPKEKVTEDFERLADRLLDREASLPAKGDARSFLGLFSRPQAEVVRA